MKYKTCKRCEKKKKLEEFIPDKRNRSGRGSICKNCKSILMKMIYDRENNMKNNFPKTYDNMQDCITDFYYDNCNKYNKK